MAGTSAILFIPDDTGRTGLSKPLLLTPVMGDRLLSWLCLALYRAGTRRVLLVCQDQWTAQALQACPGTMLAEAASPGSAGPDRLSEFLAQAEPWEEIVTVLTGPVVFDRFTAFCATSEPMEAPGPGCGVWDVAMEALTSALAQAEQTEDFDFLTFLHAAGVSYTGRDGLYPVGTGEDLQAWRMTLRRARVRDLDAGGAEIWDPDSVWAGPEVTADPGAVILPGTLLEGRTSLGEGCTVGPNARLTNAVIGPGAVVNMSQVIDATVGPGAIVGPYACLQAGTVLDRQASVGPFSQVQGATLGQGASLEGLDYLGPGRADAWSRMERGEAAAGQESVQVGRNVQIGAGATLTGPVTLGDESLIAPGSAISEDVPERALGSANPRQVNQKEYLQRRKKLK